MTAKSLEELLKPGNDGELGGIIKKARDLKDLTSALQAQLPRDLADGLLSVNLRDDVLILVCRSSAWAARLRFEEETIKSTASAIGRPASDIVVRVARNPEDQA